MSSPLAYLPRKSSAYQLISLAVLPDNFAIISVIPVNEDLQRVSI